MSERPSGGPGPAPSSSTRGGEPTRATGTAEAKVSPARDRLLAAADEIFYAEGITRTGVDRLIEAASVTRATFYRHFPGKEDLVVAYVQRRDAELREQAALAATTSPEPRARLNAVVAGIADRLLGPGFRGSPFLNAAAEYPDAESPVRAAVDAHRVWFRALLVELFMASGHDAPQFAAELLVQLRDGAEAGASLGDAVGARATFVRGAAGILGPG